MRKINRNIPRDVRAILLDETQHLNDSARADGIVRLLAVYVVDCSTNHYLCTATPARWCEGLYHVAEFRDDVSEEDRERLTDELGYPESNYFDCATVDNAEHRKFADDPEVEVEDDEEFLDDAREYFQGNCPF